MNLTSRHKEISIPFCQIPITYYYFHNSEQVGSDGSRDNHCRKGMKRNEAH